MKVFCVQTLCTLCEGVQPRCMSTVRKAKELKELDGCCVARSYISGYKICKKGGQKEKGEGTRSCMNHRPVSRHAHPYPMCVCLRERVTEQVGWTDCARQWTLMWYNNPPSQSLLSVCPTLKPFLLSYRKVTHCSALFYQNIIFHELFTYQNCFVLSLLGQTSFVEGKKNTLQDYFFSIADSP